VIAAVTGASGHVGANLVRALLDGGVRVRALVRRSDAALAGLDVERVAGDVLDPASLKIALAGADVVYHAAGVISITGALGGRVEAVNVGGARNAAEAALACGVRRFVHVSSVHVFEQEPLDRPLDESRPKLRGSDHPAYDVSKARGEEAVLEVAERGLDVVIVNPTGILGPFDFGPSRMGRTLLALAHGRLPALVDGGFDWVDARDVALGAIAAAGRGRRGENYILSGHFASMAELARQWAEITGRRAPRVVFPMALARLMAPLGVLAGRLTGQEPLYTGESLRALSANPRNLHDKASRELGHAPRPLRETLEATWKFLSDGF
jgi:dihydroflavonol-4-reductase